MAKANKLSHQLSGEAALGSRVSAAGYRWSAVGENVAYNSSRSQSGVLAVQKAMYNEKPPDDGHRRNILSRDLRRCRHRRDQRLRARQGLVGHRLRQTLAQGTGSAFDLNGRCTSAIPNKINTPQQLHRPGTLPK